MGACFGLRFDSIHLSQIKISYEKRYFFLSTRIQLTEYNLSLYIMGCVLDIFFRLSDVSSVWRYTTPDECLSFCPYFFDMLNFYVRNMMGRRHIHISSSNVGREESKLHYCFFENSVGCWLINERWFISNIAHLLEKLAENLTPGRLYIFPSGYFRIWLIVRRAFYNLLCKLFVLQARLRIVSFYVVINK